MTDKSFLGRQILDHLKFYSDLGVRWVRSPEKAGRTASNRPGKRVIPPAPAPRTGIAASTYKTMAYSSMFDQVPSAQESLETVRTDLGDCRRCKLWQSRNTIVFGSGNPCGELMFVGEAPGADEDEQGLPFVGRAGQLLTRIIEAIGMRRDEV